MPHYSYSYSRAVEDGVCRPTAFFTYGGEVSWREELGDVSARFSDPLDHIASSRRLRAALDPASGWLNPLVKDANNLLTDLRKEHPNAGALLVAPDQISARKIAQLIQQITGTPPVVILSDDSEASRRLKSFRDSSLPWLVACNMVSEGVDIPRLRIGIYATTIRTKMYFRQFLGRVVRRVADLKCLQVAYCYLPADPVLTKLAEEIEEEIRHCINPKNNDSPFEERERVSKSDKDSPPPTFEPLRAVSSGIDTVIVHGNQLSLFQTSMVGQEVMDVVHSKVAQRLDERRSKAEEKAFLALEVRRLVSMYHKRSGKTHAQIHSQLNAAQGIKSQAFCTENQLRERLSLLRRFVGG
jgi:superfamily II DNA or RNA helicase